MAQLASRRILCVSVLLHSLTQMTTRGQEAPATFRHRLDALRSHLLTNYSRHFAPLIGQSQEGPPLPIPVPVHMELALSSILDLNAADQVRDIHSIIIVIIMIIIIRE
jgi:hypothetical protein